MNAVWTMGLWAGAIGTGLMAGVYFTFSAFMMRSLEAMPSAQGIAAMQSINTRILSSAFMPLFFGTSLLAAAFCVWGLTHGSTPIASHVVAAGAVYVIGMFVCTAALNVPLNEALDAVSPTSAEGVELWPSYVRTWTRYNHIRTIASLVASGLFIHAIAHGG